MIAEIHRKKWNRRPQRRAELEHMPKDLIAKEGPTHPLFIRDRSRSIHTKPLRKEKCRDRAAEIAKLLKRSDRIFGQPQSKRQHAKNEQAPGQHAREPERFTQKFQAHQRDDRKCEADQLRRCQHPERRL